MALNITSLNSGSNGNCYYIGNETDAVLIDIGLSCKELELRMSRLGLAMDLIRAVFISHEHSDHISGLKTLLKKYPVPVFITPQTLRNGKLRFEANLINHFVAHEVVRIGDLRVTAFPKFHDACDPHSFIVTDGSVNIGVFTDIGQVCEHLTIHFSQCHAAFLESNYDEVMLSEGRYPWYLKNRITSGKGHLSNRQALDLFLNHRPAHMTHLLLAHLSKENNCPDLVSGLFNRHAGSTTITIAGRYVETPVFRILPTAALAPAPLPQSPRKASPAQLSLF